MLNDFGTPVHEPNDPPAAAEPERDTIGHDTGTRGRDLFAEIDALRADFEHVRAFIDSDAGKQLLSDGGGLLNLKADVAMLKQATGMHGLEESARALFHLRP
ncbi:MAG: hypothetical protein NVSMB19_15850 [Vulcanimicrobiaceae bacterium]